MFVNTTTLATTFPAAAPVRNVVGGVTHGTGWILARSIRVLLEVWQTSSKHLVRQTRQLIQIHHSALCPVEHLLTNFRLAADNHTKHEWCFLRFYY
jgi:hypothetical protein